MYFSAIKVSTFIIVLVSVRATESEYSKDSSNLPDYTESYEDQSIVESIVETDANQVQDSKWSFWNMFNFDRKIPAVSSRKKQDSSRALESSESADQDISDSTFYTSSNHQSPILNDNDCIEFINLAIKGNTALLSKCKNSSDACVLTASYYSCQNEQFHTISYIKNTFLHLKDHPIIAYCQLPEDFSHAKRHTILKFSHMDRSTKIRNQARKKLFLIYNGQFPNKPLNLTFFEISMLIQTRLVSKSNANFFPWITRILQDVDVNEAATKSFALILEYYLMLLNDESERTNLVISLAQNPYLSVLSWTRLLPYLNSKTIFQTSWTSTHTIAKRVRKLAQDPFLNICKIKRFPLTSQISDLSDQSRQTICYLWIESTYGIHPSSLVPITGYLPAEDEVSRLLEPFRHKCKYQSG